MTKIEKTNSEFDGKVLNNAQVVIKIAQRKNYDRLYLHKLSETSKRGLQSSKSDKTLKTSGRTRFSPVMVKEGAKLINVLTKLLRFSKFSCKEQTVLQLDPNYTQ